MSVISIQPSSKRYLRSQMDNQTVLERLKSRFGDASLESKEFRGELTVIIPKDRIVEVCSFLKSDPELSYEFLSDLCGIDMYAQEKRFGVIYNVLSLKNKHRLRVKTFVEEDDPKLKTVFGIVFEGHPDLRRMYMPEDFDYFPLRKDFPLMGIPGSLPLPKK